jgi:hypothetical protein
MAVGNHTIRPKEPTGSFFMTLTSGLHDFVGALIRHMLSHAL